MVAVGSESSRFVGSWVREFQTLVQWGPRVYIFRQLGPRVYVFGSWVRASCSTHLARRACSLVQHPSRREQGVGRLLTRLTKGVDDVRGGGGVVGAVVEFND